jgi:hypothetical protein
MSRVALFILSLFVFVSHAIAAEADSALAIKDWVATRVRKTAEASNVVLGEFKLTNTSDAEVSDIAIVISYQMADGQELRASEPTVIPKLAPRETKEVAIQTGWAPNYECYEIRLTFRDAHGEHKSRWVGRGEQGQPVLIPSAPRDAEPRVLILGDVLWWDKPNAPLQAVLRVTNVSPSPLEKVVVKITFDDGGRPPKILGTSSVAFGDGRLAVGEEKTVKFSVPNAPSRYGAYRIDFTYASKSAPSEFARWNGGEFLGEAKVEAAQWNFERPFSAPDGLSISARLRNNLLQPLESATLRVAFIQGSGDQKRVVREVFIHLNEELAAGATRDVEITLKNFKTSFDAIERSIHAQPKSAAP